jgi:hypothetical protein
VARQAKFANEEYIEWRVKRPGDLVGNWNPTTWQGKDEEVALANDTRQPLGELMTRIGAVAEDHVYASSQLSDWTWLNPSIVSGIVHLRRR